MFAHSQNERHLPVIKVILHGERIFITVADAGSSLWQVVLSVTDFNLLSAIAASRLYAVHIELQMTHIPILMNSPSLLWYCDDTIICCLMQTRMYPIVIYCTVPGNSSRVNDGVPRTLQSSYTLLLHYVYIATSIYTDIVIVIDAEA